MAVFCPKCGKKTYNEYNCDHCQHEIKAQDSTQQKFKVKTQYTTPCSVCGNDIAVKATSCPYCGDTKSKNLFWKIIKIIVIVMAVMFVVNLILASIGIVLFKNEMTKVNKEMTKVLDSYKPITLPQVQIKESQYQKEQRIKQEKRLQSERAIQMKINHDIKESKEAKEELKRQMAL